MTGTQEVAVRELQVDVVPAPALFEATSPEDVVAKATDAAKALAAVIEDRKLYSTINRRKHVSVEGWTLLGSMLKVYPIVEWSRPTEDGEGWEARVSVRNLDGQEIGSAEAMCTRNEPTWKTRADYALRSMAQTRAVSKAMRHPLGFVMTLAGYDPTPAAEMPKPDEEIVVVEKISEPTLQELIVTLPKAEFFDPERWTLDSVLATAQRIFGHEVNSLSDLSEDEGKRILEGASKLVAQGEAAYEESLKDQEVLMMEEEEA